MACLQCKGLLGILSRPSVSAVSSSLIFFIFFFATFEILWGKKNVLDGIGGLQSHLCILVFFFFLLRETMYSGCSCYKRIIFLLGFLSGEFLSSGQAEGHSALFISFPLCICPIPAWPLDCSTSTKEVFLRQKGFY